MTLWRLKTEPAAGNISRYCIDYEVAAMGWCFAKQYIHGILAKHSDREATELEMEIDAELESIKTFEEFSRVFWKYDDNKNVNNVKLLATEVEANDLIWMHSIDGYFLARVKEYSRYRFCNLGREYDAANQLTNIHWYCMNDELVPDEVRKSFMGPYQTFRRINGEEAERLSRKLFNELRDPEEDSLTYND